MRQILVATRNKDKVREIREIFSDIPDLEILSLDDAALEVDIEEYGKSFEVNALIKAKAIRDITDTIVLADDSGLEVDALDKQPGVYSARWMGEDTDYHTKNQEILRLLEGKTGEERSARFVCAVAAAFPDDTCVVVRATMEGSIGYEERGENGFGYDPIFFLPEAGCTSAQLSLEEKDQISHRGKAFRKIKRYLERTF